MDRAELKEKLDKEKELSDLSAKIESLGGKPYLLIFYCVFLLVLPFSGKVFGEPAPYWHVFVMFGMAFAYGEMSKATTTKNIKRYIDLKLYFAGNA